MARLHSRGRYWPGQVITFFHGDADNDEDNIVDDDEHSDVDDDDDDENGPEKMMIG